MTNAINTVLGGITRVEPSPELRWLNGVLQQAWLVWQLEPVSDNVCSFMKEWRDVPHIVEETPS